MEMREASLRAGWSAEALARHVAEANLQNGRNATSKTKSSTLSSVHLQRTARKTERAFSSSVSDC
ncbi:hypothetical protein [Bradyrhizobium sp. CCGE-LA001]|uniref:hypothetical protein n=1 Tax=Bradyrhizobium sp. CCGE-LA001 TaxID=1223566 RepID=UPI001198283F|nr:hypothetical protein [Bradyrhizobium sp. CCGE-LA001]